ncbi:pentapeptide repeat-containing protein [Streptomyces sp. SBT349]|uniref:pentapeptide repeat-containing protein n=1 Tax=Streptomyces sp. SBT349 TaxID=1580539 RepID=UPI00131E5965|nr:pentapeptide repeat-containing protein [Streptomyces sp. SBT349]
MTSAEQAAAMGQLRLAVVQLAALLGAGVALLVTVFTYRLSRRGQVTDRFIKALERLGSEELYVRLGGVLALEQIMQDAPDQAPHAAAVLEAFVCERAPRRRGGASLPGSPPPLPEHPATDIQLALSALTRPKNRRHSTATILLDGLHLAGAGANFSDLTHMQLSRADLTRAQFTWSDLTDVRFFDADLTDALLNGARLNGARLNGANLTGAQLGGADLRGAIGLSVEQVVSARPTLSTKLPPEVAADPAVVRRLLEEGAGP